MTDHDSHAASNAALHDLMTGEGSSETYRATAATVYALHDIADAIRATAPKPVETKTAAGLSADVQRGTQDPTPED